MSKSPKYHHEPPKLATRFLRWYCRAELVDEVEGDLYELFQRRAEEQGIWKAKILYWLNVLMFLHPDHIRKRKESYTLNHTDMFRNYFKIAFRNLLGKKFYSTINIMGLAVGIAGFLLITCYVVFEMSYDDFHLKADQIYRVQLNQYKNGELNIASAENYPGAGPTLKEELPEVLEYTRLYNMGKKNNIVITYEEAPDGPVQFKLNTFLYADSSFFSLFSFPLIQGDPQTALAAPFTAVVSESYAKKFFGDEDPIGKVLRLQDDDFNDERCQVTGVFRDLPLNSHLKFDVLFSYQTLYSRHPNRGDWARGRYDLTWERKDFYTYIRVREGTDPVTLATKFPAIIDKYNPGLAAQQRRDVFVLQPLLDIHLYSDLVDEAEANGNARMVYALLYIAGFILMIAWINYINLSTARATERGREVGVRKALGAFRQQLMKQFLVESLLVNLLAVVVAALLASLLLPMFNALTGLHFSFLSFWSQPWIWGMLAAIFMTGSLLSGLYPAFILSSFRPASVLKGKLRTASHGIGLRRALVVFQFASAIVLVAGTAIVYQQLQFMLQQDLGFNMEQTLVLERPSILPEDEDVQKSQYEQFKTELLRSSAIQQVSGVSFIMGNSRTFKYTFRKYGEPAEEAQAIRVNGVGYNYFDMFEMDLLAGRSFSEAYTTDLDTAMVITESAAQMLGFNPVKEAIGSTLTFNGQNSEDNHRLIIGVVNNFHQASLKEAVEPMIFFPSDFGSEYVVMKVGTQDLPQTIEYVQATWNEVFSGNPFTYFFLDDYFNRQYQMDQRFSQLIRIFAGLALFIGGLGLLGLSAFTVQQRTKEIGIRKVLGASITSVIMLLSKDFTKLMLIAIAIAIPLTILTMNEWLETYAFRIQIGAGILIAAGLSTLLLAWLTVSWQSIKAAIANPVDSLRNE